MSESPIQLPVPPTITITLATTENGPALNVHANEGITSNAMILDMLLAAVKVAATREPEKASRLVVPVPRFNGIKG